MTRAERPIELPLRDGYRLTSLHASDAPELVRWLSDGEISALIPVIPYPYEEHHAQTWIEHRAAFLAKSGSEISFALRRSDGRMIGSVGVDDYPVGRRHNAELGYWLGRDARGVGIAREAVRAFIRYAFEQLGLERLSAHTLVDNVASARLLDDLGFQREGLRRKFVRVRGGLHDALLFGLLRTDIAVDDACDRVQL